jgi:hypothetical protein
MYFNPPVQNQYYADWTTLSSSTQWSFVVNFISTQVLLIFASVKLYAFVIAVGPKFHVPQVTLLLLVFAGIVGTYVSLTGRNSWRSDSSFLVSFFFQPWPNAFVMTANLLLGLYFYVLSRPHRIRVPGLKFMFWPSVIIFVVVWTLFIICSALNSSPAFFASGQEVIHEIVIVEFAFLQVGIIVQFAVVTYGAVMFLILLWVRLRDVKSLAANRQRSQFWITFTISKTLFSTWTITAFFTLWNCVYSSNEYPLASLPLSEYSNIIFAEFISVFIPSVCGCILVSNFHVSDELKTMATSRSSGSGSQQNVHGTAPKQTTSRSRSDLAVGSNDPNVYARVTPSAVMPSSNTSVANIESGASSAKEYIEDQFVHSSTDISGL